MNLKSIILVVLVLLSILAACKQEKASEPLIKDDEPITKDVVTIDKQNQPDTNTSDWYYKELSSDIIPEGNKYYSYTFVSDDEIAYGSENKVIIENILTNKITREYTMPGNVNSIFDNQLIKLDNELIVSCRMNESWVGYSLNLNNREVKKIIKETVEEYDFDPDSDVIISIKKDKNMKDSESIIKFYNHKQKKMITTSVFIDIDGYIATNPYRHKNYYLFLCTGYTILEMKKNAFEVIEIKNPSVKNGAIRPIFTKDGSIFGILDESHSDSFIDESEYFIVLKQFKYDWKNEVFTILEYSEPLFISDEGVPERIKLSFDDNLLIFHNGFFNIERKNHNYSVILAKNKYINW